MCAFNSRRRREGVRGTRGAAPAPRERKITIPEGLWVKCPGCTQIIYNKDLDANQQVCPKCAHHFRISAADRLRSLFDDGKWTEHFSNLTSTDPLKFTDTKPYRNRLKDTIAKTGMKDAVIIATGSMDGVPVVIAAMEYTFIGGSMGVVVGEKITRAIELATRKRIPLLIVTCSGGARMQEGVLSLMQMAKTSAALGRLAEERVPYFVLLADPTTGGVTASFAMLGDLILAEPKALIGFAGPRVIQETIRQPLPEGFQRSEFLLEHGMVDRVVERKDLRELLRRLLAFFAEPAEPAAP